MNSESSTEGRDRRTDLALTLGVRVGFGAGIPIRAAAVAQGRVDGARAGVPEQVREERRGVPAAGQEEQEAAADIDVRRGGRPRGQQDRRVDHVREL